MYTQRDASTGANAKRCRRLVFRGCAAFPPKPHTCAGTERKMGLSPGPISEEKKTSAAAGETKVLKRWAYFRQVLKDGAFGGTYFRQITSAVTGKTYQDVHLEFPEEWFKGLHPRTYKVFFSFPCIFFFFYMYTWSFSRNGAKGCVPRHARFFFFLYVLSFSAGISGVSRGPRQARHKF